jgi:hypothetical protein
LEMELDDGSAQISPYHVMSLFLLDYVWKPGSVTQSSLARATSALKITLGNYVQKVGPAFC